MTHVSLNGIQGFSGDIFQNLVHCALAFDVLYDTNGRIAWSHRLLSAGVYTSWNDG